MNRIVAISTTALALTSCSYSPPFCGESFCFTERPTAFSKETPTEDFNLYRTDFAGKRFLIYEGNHPNTAGDQDFGSIEPDSVPTGFVQGKLYGSERGYQVVLRTTNQKWPAYVVVSAVTKNANDLETLLSKLRGKQSKQG
jgi:hypothetical protein